MGIRATVFRQTVIFSESSARSTIPAGCRELTAEEGFPIIDRSRVVLRRNARGTSPAIEGLAATVREAFRPLSGGAV